MNINPAIFKNKKIIVTGGTGTIGTEIVRQLLRLPIAQVRVYSRNEHRQYQLIQEFRHEPRLRFLLGDIRDKDRMHDAFQGAHICYHAAALKQLPLCEYNPYEAVKTNIIGSQNVVELAIKHNLEKVVAISTDKAVDPSSVLGASKLMMEKLVVAARHITGGSRTLFSVVRFGNVLHSRGSVLEIWEEQIKRGQPLTITHPRMTRYFMDTSEAVHLILKVTELMRGGEIFVLKMKKTTIKKLAEETFRRLAPGTKLKMKIIGPRPGERMYEKLLTEEETKRAYATDNMYVLLPEVYPEFAPRKTVRYQYKKVKGNIHYRSDR